MPELPEIETLKLGIQKYVVGHKILSVEKSHPKILQGDPEHIIGAEITGVRRVGKGLILDLDNGYCLAIHVKLTGQIIYRDDETKDTPVSKEKVGTLPNLFTHIILELDRNAKLYYNDQRRFGWIKIVPEKDLSSLSFFRDMGPEPFEALGQNAPDPMRDLTFNRFKFILSKKVTKIKPALMDQVNIGGIGNIYANDGLFCAGISPMRSAKTLSEEELKKLYDCLLKVLKKGFESHGASELSFVNILGQEGEYQNHTLVYGKRGKPCPRCGRRPGGASGPEGGKILFTKIGGRGSYYCPNCQH